jgi:hypothetical protein
MVVNINQTTCPRIPSELSVKQILQEGSSCLSASPRRHLASEKRSTAKDAKKSREGREGILEELCFAIFAMPWRTLRLRAFSPVIRNFLQKREKFNSGHCLVTRLTAGLAKM